MIPAGHQRFIDKAVGILRQDPRICGIALCGSYVTGNMDEYSDLDFMLFIEPEFFDQILGERTALIGKLGGLLSAFSGEHIGVPDLLICLFESPLLHADFNFLPGSEVQKRIHGAAILYDKSGALTEASGDAEVVERGLNLQWIEDRFWVWVHYTALKIGRGELFEAIDAISFIRATVLGPMIHVRKGGSPRGVRRLEQMAPEYLPTLVKTVPSYGAESCAEALKAELMLYRTLREPLSDGFTRRLGAELAAEAYLNEVTAAAHHI